MLESRESCREAGGASVFRELGWTGLTNGLQVPRLSPVSRRLLWPPLLARGQAVTLSRRCTPPASHPLNLSLSLLCPHLYFTQLVKWASFSYFLICCVKKKLWNYEMLLTTLEDSPSAASEDHRVRSVSSKWAEDIACGFMWCSMHLLEAKSNSYHSPQVQPGPKMQRRRVLPLNLLWSKQSLAEYHLIEMKCCGKHTPWWKSWGQRNAWI